LSLMCARDSCPVNNTVLHGVPLILSGQIDRHVPPFFPEVLMLKVWLWNIQKDDEPVKDTMEEGSAVFFKFRSVGQEPAVAGTELPQRTQQEPPAQTDAGPSSRDEARNLTSWTPEGSPEITVHVVRPRHEGRKNREPWEPQHVESLLKGIERHGLGTWSKILTDSQLSFPESANQVTLKDKWRNLSKTISSGAKARGINVTEELRRRVLGIQMAYGEH